MWGGGADYKNHQRPFLGPTWISGGGGEGAGGNDGVMPRTIQSHCKRLNPVHTRENPVNAPTAFLTIEMVFTTPMTRLVAYAA
jgi:hypothetical protein